MHQLCPDAERRSIHRQHVVRLGQKRQPALKLSRFFGILLTCDLDAGLNLADGHGREVKIGLVRSCRRIVSR